MGISRRHVILGAASVSLAALAGGGAVLVRATSPRVRLTSLDQVQRVLDRLEPRAGELTALRSEAGGWSLDHVFEHCAQSLEFAVTGFPEVKPALFTETVGKLALAFFEARGAMTHGLSSPIPGAPDLADGADVGAGITRLRAAIGQFKTAAGPLAPHFAYGTVDRAAYDQVQAMHVANHLDTFPALTPLIA